MNGINHYATFITMPFCVSGPISDADTFPNQETVQDICFFNEISVLQFSSDVFCM